MDKRQNVLCPICLGTALVLTGGATAQVFWVDMDASTVGIIESSITASPGDKITAALVLDLGVSFPTGVSAYSVTARFDTVELSLDGSPAATAIPPVAWVGLGAPAESETIGGGLGEVAPFSAFTFTLPGGSLYSGTHVLGTIDYDVDSVVGDGSPDVELGFLYAGIDGANDDTGATYSPGTFTFMPGYVVPVPEPRTYALCGALGLLGFAAWRRRRSG